MYAHWTTLTNGLFLENLISARRLCCPHFSRNPSNLHLHPICHHHLLQTQLFLRIHQVNNLYLSWSRSDQNKWILLEEKIINRVYRKFCHKSKHKTDVLVVYLYSVRRVKFARKRIFTFSFCGILTTEKHIPKIVNCLETDTKGEIIFNIV